MTQSAADLVAAIKTLVEQAKSVPMSASCMVNRSEVVGLLDQAMSAVREEQDAATKASGAEAIAAAQAEACLLYTSRCV